MAGLTSKPLALDKELALRWVLETEEAEPVYVVIRFRILPKGTAGPRNILLCADTLEKLGH